MPTTRTLLVDIRKLERQGDEGLIALRLMIACNDLTTVNHALARCRKDTSERTQYVDQGSEMYFIRLQIAHLNEALKVIVDLRDHPNLRRMVDDCHGSIADYFVRLLSFAPGETNQKQFLKYVELVRHNITFHYDKGRIRAALKDRSKRLGDTAHFMTIADHVGLIRFRVADDVISTLIYRQIWKIPLDADLDIEVKRISEVCSELCEKLIKFAKAFLNHYVEKNALFTR
jgi:hypothetical protein